MPSPWGSIESTEIPPPERIRAAVQSCERHVWRPSSELDGHVPDGFRLEFQSTTDQTGVRRFQPADWQAFPILAACGGLAIKESAGLIDGERVFSFRTSQLLFQLHMRLRDNLSRVFTRAKDLYRSPHCNEDGSSHIIPEDLRLASIRADAPPTPTDVIASGRQLANDRGLPVGDGDDATLIQLALDDAARRNPFRVDGLAVDERLRIVRLGLFAVGPATERVSDELRQEVIHRLLESLEKHIDSPTDEFNRWFFDQLDNLVKQVAKRKRNPGPIDRQFVRQVILEQVFESNVHLADLVDEQMRAVANALPVPLSEQERSIYAALYFRQEWLGGLSVAMLASHFPLLKSLLTELVADPTDPLLQGAVLRRLLINAEMVHRKRAADAEYQRRRRAKDDFPPAIVGGPETAASNILQGIAAEVRDKRDLTCECQTSASWRAEAFGNNEDEGSVTWVDRCPDCDQTFQVTVAQNEFQSLYLANT